MCERPSVHTHCVSRILLLTIRASGSKLTHSYRTLPPTRGWSYWLPLAVLCTACYAEPTTLSVAQIKRKFVSVEDHVAALAFGLPTEMDPGEGGKLRAVWPIAGAADGGDVRLVWLDNDFPYALQAGIQHRVLWSTGALDEGTLRAAIAARYDAAKWECAWFVNPPALKSVKRIEHAHVLCRLKAP
jgi:hypothetical protein